MTRSIFLTPYSKLLDLLIQARQAAGLKQQELADRLGRPQSFVSKFEHAERRLDVIEFLFVCRAIDVDPIAIVAAVNAELGDDQ